MPETDSPTPPALPAVPSRSAKPVNSLVALWRIPVFRRLWMGITLSSLGDWLGLLATTALAAYLTRDSSSIMQGAAVSGVLVTRLLPDLILGPVAGALVDRFDRRKVAIIGDLAAGAVYLTIAFVPNLGVLLVGQFLVEAIGLFSTPAKQAMWVNIVPRERLAVANQLNYVSIYGMVPVASVVFALLSTISQFFRSAPESTVTSSGLIAGSSVSRTAVVIALVINALSFVVSAGILYISRRSIPAFVGERSTTRSVFSLVKEGISFVKNSRVMRALYIGILGAFGAGGLVAGVAQAYVGTLGAGSAGYGILFGSVFTGLALGMLVGPKVLPGVPRRVVFTASITLAGAMLLVMSLIQDFLGSVVTASVLGLGAGVAWINGFTMIGHEVSDQLRGRVFAFVMSSVRLTLLGTIAVGPVLAGAIGPHRITVGQFTMFLSGPGIVLAIGGLIAIAVSMIAGRQSGRLRSGIVTRMMRRRRLLAEHHDRPGVLIAVEGTDPAVTALVADAIAEQVRDQGWYTLQEKGDARQGDSAAALGDALRVTAELSDVLTERVEPALAAGAVVVYQDYLDAVVVRYGAVGGLDEERLLRVGMWVSRGAWPDLTVLTLPEPDDVPTVMAPAAGDERRADPVGVDAGGESARLPGRAGGAESAEVPNPRAPATVDGVAVAAGVPAAERNLAAANGGVSDGGVVDGRVPNGSVPNGSVPNGSVPNGSVPNGSVPNGSVPNGSVPNGSVPNGGVSDGRDHDDSDRSGGDRDDEVVDLAQSYRERAASAPERYVTITGLESGGELPADVTDRIASVLRLRMPAKAPAAPIGS